MKAALYLLEDPALLCDGIFLNESFYSMRNCVFIFSAMRNQLAQYSIDLATQDINPPQQSDTIIGLGNSLPLQKHEWRKELKNALYFTSLLPIIQTIVKLKIIRYLIRCLPVIRL